MREVTFDNGHVMRINVAPFAEAKELFEALMFEVRGIPYNTHMQITSLFKDLFCTGFSSRLIDSKLWPCLARCTYNNGSGAFEKVVPSIFESEAARDNYTRVCTEVVKDNAGPFVKNLSYLLLEVTALVESFQKST